MAVPHTVNKSLLQCNVPSEDEAKQIVEDVISKLEKNLNTLVEGLDPDALNFIDQDYDFFLISY